MADLANAIEAVVGVRVVTNRKVKDAGGNLQTEFDILGPDFVVEVTVSPKSAKKIRQLVRIIRPHARARGIARIAIFAPNAEPEWTTIVERSGIAVHRTHEQVIRWIGGEGPEGRRDE